MSNSVLIQLGVFVAVLIALNFFFQWHISIIGSLALTIVLNLAFRLMASR